MLGNSKPNITAEADECSPGKMLLRRDVKIEPLVDSWYAWPHLLWPVQSALNLTYRYLPIAQSFVSAPSVHIAANRDPTMYGGPFMELSQHDVGAVRSYIQETTKSRATAIEFAKVYRQFESLLQSRANGFSLNEIRQEMPVQLRGRVELSYDCHNHARIRLLDEMFTFDDLGAAESQGVLLHRQLDIERQFFLSTPRLAVPDSLYIGAPLGSFGIRALCEARTNPVELADLAASLNVDVDLLLRFFEPAGSHRQNVLPSPTQGVRIRYFGHASVLVETPESNILIDPSFAFDQIEGIDHYTFFDLPDKIDILFISHGHQDHFLPEVLMQLRYRVDVVIVPPSHLGELSDPPLKRILRNLGYDNIVVLDPLESYELPGGKITVLPFSGEHCDLDVHAKQCGLFELDGRKICLFVDSDAIDIDAYRRLKPLIDDPDVMLVGMECNGAPLSWLYGPLLPGAISKRNDDSRRLSGADSQRAWRLAEEIRPKQAYVYAMGQEPWMKYLMGLNYAPDSIQLLESSTFVSNCLAQGIEAKLLQNFAEIIL
jgi:L-ascorbate metabolism protein UlaG (beta-lactamase superfamily)